MANSSKEIQVVGSIFVGLTFGAIGVRTLWTGSFSANHHGSGLQIHGTQALVIGIFWLGLGLLMVAAPVIERWWQSR